MCFTVQIYVGITMNLVSFKMIYSMLQNTKKKTERHVGTNTNLYQIWKIHRNCRLLFMFIIKSQYCADIVLQKHWLLLKIFICYK